MIYRRELYDLAEAVNLAVLLGEDFPKLREVRDRCVSEITGQWQLPSGAYRTRKLLVGWNNVPMHRWGLSIAFRSLCLFFAGSKQGRLKRQRDSICCGICGQLNFKREEPADPSLLEAMKNTIIHRGPDDQGTFIDGPLGFGFRRLSIIDLSLGHQPMSDQDKTVWVVFNGEIYNFLELRRELEAKGCVFQTNCDTEVIVHGYKIWGDDALQRFNGMFGLAIWDVKKRRLLIARDKSGIKLIYYKIHDGCLYFGSEIRPVLAAVKNKAELDPTALQLFFRYRYTPSPLTLYRGIMKLPAGTMMTVENGKVQIKRFWQFRPKPFSPPPSEEEAREKLIDLYRTAVRRQLMADVPLGLLLSGGFDSALLLALITQEGGKRQTFTVGYGAEHDPDDELDDAAKTAKAFGSEHHSIRIDQGAFDKLLPEVVNILEEPVATASIIPMYFVCQCARQNVKVALVGQGPDELFGGYNRHLGIQAGAWWRKLPGWTRSLVRGAARNVPRREGLKRGLRSLDQPDRVQRFLEVFALLPENDLSELFRPGLLTGDSGVTLRECWSELEPGLANLDELSAFNYLEIASSLPDELLMYWTNFPCTTAWKFACPIWTRILSIIPYACQTSIKFAG